MDASLSTFHGRGQGKQVMMKLISIFLLSAVLSACSTNPDGSTVVGMQGSPAWRKTASPEIVAEYYGKRCESYGFRSGTDAMASCIQSEISDDASMQRERGEKIQADISKSFERNQPTYTRCSKYRYTSSSSTINCYSY